MKLIVRRGGGLAGMVRRTDLDAAVLAEEPARDFAVMVERAQLRGAGPAGAEPTAGSAAGGRWPDALSYEVQLDDDDGASHSHSYTDPTLPPDVARLLQWLDGRPERTDSVER
ncbi:hypothetical protein KIH31_06690 [Paenarthrobacter sp. DKR-5]|uniref:protealysin inhibitor emfourin n=1 Tax=Paenarthrobacter sp. DKR-5 TaxID=2835535 RepID=UPI001BDCC062|nr:protealysin inhibitor emfourin [Paenarthrobacter sp. DKR-5]MBT1002285.1 hypothetical protein [Paenarthrobacter sp. DKR-5]